MIIRMIKEALIRRKVKKLFKELRHTAFDVFGPGTYGRRLSIEKLPGYVPCEYWPGWWVEGDDLFRERLLKEQHGKR